MKTVIEMAREIWSAGNVYIGPSEKSLAQFAELVRADERNAAEERVVDLFTDMEMPYLPDIVNAIRERGQA